MSEKLNVKSVTSTKKSRKTQKQPSDPINEKYHNLLVQSEKILTEWKKCSIAGNILINEEILAKKKEHFCEGKQIETIVARIIRGEFKVLSNTFSKF